MDSTLSRLEFSYIIFLSITSRAIQIEHFQCITILTHFFALFKNKQKTVSNFRPPIFYPKTPNTMTASKINQLSHAHFEHKLWRNEIELVSQEATFFLKVLNDYKVKTISHSHNSLVVAEFVKQFHHFQRLTKRLLEELNLIEKEIAQGVLSENILDNEQKKDHEYMKEEMKYFEYDYRETKASFRNFIANYETSLSIY